MHQWIEQERAAPKGGMTKSLDVIRIQVTSNRVFGEERRNISSVKDEEKRTKNGALRNTVLDLNPGRSSVVRVAL